MVRTLANKQKTYGPFKGLCTFLPEKRIGGEWCRDSQNVEIRNGSIRKRRGWKKLNTVPIGASLNEDTFNRPDAPTLGDGWVRGTADEMYIKVNAAWADLNGTANAYYHYFKTGADPLPPQLGTADFSVKALVDSTFFVYPPTEQGFVDFHLFMRRPTLNTPSPNHDCYSVFYRWNYSPTGTPKNSTELGVGYWVDGVFTATNSVPVWEGDIPQQELGWKELVGEVSGYQPTRVKASITVDGTEYTVESDLGTGGTGGTDADFENEGYQGMGITPTGLLTFPDTAIALVGHFYYYTEIPAVSGLHHYIGKDGLREVLAKATNKLYRFNEGTSTFDIIGDTSNTLRPTFQTALGYCYVASGGTAPLQRYDGTTLLPAGLQPPGGNPRAADDGSGGEIEAGLYRWYMTHYDSVHDVESLPEPSLFYTGELGTATISNNHKALLTYLTAPPAQADKVRFYRLNITLGETLPRLVAEVDKGDVTFDSTTAGWTDTKADKDLGDFINIFMLPPPNGITLLEFRSGRMFAVSDEDRTKLIWSVDTVESGVANPIEYFPGDNAVYVGREDGENIIAIKDFGQLLIIFKSRSIWTLSGFDPSTWLGPRRVDTDIGAIAEESVHEIETVMHFAAEKGVYRWAGGGEPEKLTLAIEDLYYRLDRETLDQWSAIEDPNRGMYRLACRAPVDQTQRNNRLYNLQYEIPGTDAEVGPLFAWHSANITASCFCMETTSSGQYRVHFGRYDGFVGTLAGSGEELYTDDGAEYGWFWKGPKLGFGEDSRKKRVFSLVAHADKEPSGVLNVGFLYDDVAEPIIKSFDQATMDDPLVRVETLCRHFTPFFSGEIDSNPSHLNGFTIDYDVTGRF